MPYMRKLVNDYVLYHLFGRVEQTERIAQIVLGGTTPPPRTRRIHFDTLIRNAHFPRLALGDNRKNTLGVFFESFHKPHPRVFAR